MEGKLCVFVGLEGVYGLGEAGRVGVRAWRRKGNIDTLKRSMDGEDEEADAGIKMEVGGTEDQMLR